MSLFKRRLQTSGLCRLDNCNNSERSSNRFLRTAQHENPYRQEMGHKNFADTLGHKELTSAHFWLSLLSECLSCYIYVFIVCSTRISWTGAIIGHEPNLLAMSLSSGIAMMLLIFTFRTVHVNPALTISFLLTGRIPLVRAILYIISHCLGSIAAVAFLYSISVRGHAGALGLDNPHEQLNSWQILTVEIVISFVVTIATYATCNYSSYACAKQEMLDQLGQNLSLLQGDTSDDNNFPQSQSQFSQHLAQTHRPHHLRRSVAPIIPEPMNFRTLPPSKALPSNSYQEDSSDYEYDNHRIYATQQLKSASTSPKISIEESMKSECQLLAPNGFSLHMTSGQALIIGLAYALTSLSGIPASGASLNPARSLGPAFIMNHWERHWIYWLGPIAGAVVAGFFYEFIFSPTRGSSLCYRPKLFRLSAHDMAKMGSKSRLNQQQQNHLCQASQQNCSPIMPSTMRPAATTTIHRPQLHNNQTLHLSPNSSSRPQVMHANSISNSSLLKPTRESQLINPASTSAANQSSYPINAKLDQMLFMRQQQQHQMQDIEASSQMDRSKSSAIINAAGASILSQQFQTNGLNMINNGRLNGDGKFATQSRFMDQIEFR